MPSAPDPSGDIEAIRRLKARYVRSLDGQDWEALRAVFTDDAEIDVSDDGAGVVQGAATIASSIAAALEGASTAHQATTAEIDVSGDEARGVWAMTDVIVFADGTRLEGSGHYHERYRRVGGEWLIAGLRLTRISRELS